MYLTTYNHSKMDDKDIGNQILENDVRYLKKKKKMRKDRRGAANLQPPFDARLLERNVGLNLSIKCLFQVRRITIFNCQ